MKASNRLVWLLGAAALVLLAAAAPLAAQGEARASANPTAMLTPPPLCTAPQVAAVKAGEPMPNPDGTPAARGRGGRGGGVACHMPDPREGLKAGLYDAGQAAWNMQLVTSLRQPAGMFNPDTQTAAGRNLDYANSDLAFGNHGELAIQGNFHGLILYNISNPPQTMLETIVTCPGGQGDVSVWGHLAFMSVESYGRTDCGAQPSPAAAARGAAGRGARGAAAPTPPAAAARGAAEIGAAGGGFARPTAPPDPNRMYGVRIFDISDPRNPRQVADVQTCRGSHTHSLAVDPNDKDNIYIYVSGTAGVRSAQEKSGCVNGGANVPNTSSFGIDVIKVPIAHPEQAAVVNHAYIFADANTGQLASLYGRQQGTGEPQPTPTQGCHDVTSYPYYRLLGGACAGNGLLLDITDPVHPQRLDDVADSAFSFWHSATFNNDATKVLFSDEWGGGTQPMCQKNDPPMWGGDAVYDIAGSGAGRHLKFEGYYKMPAWQTATENCVAHNGGLIPVPGRDIMSQAFYQGGATVFDFTDPAHIKEIAYFDRGPIAADHLVIGGYWSVYYYDGYLYGSEIARGFDVMQLTPSPDLSQNEIDAAKLAVREGCGDPGDLNEQCQPHYTWPASFTVARAYLDQLARDNALPQDRIAALEAGMKSVESANGGARKTAAGQLDGLAAALNQSAASAAPQDAKRMRDCATTITRRDAELK